MQVVENPRKKGPETGKGKISFKATRKEGKQRVKLRHHSREIPGNSRQNRIESLGTILALPPALHQKYLSAELFCMKSVMDSKGVLELRQETMRRLRYNVYSGLI